MDEAAMEQIEKAALARCEEIAGEIAEEIRASPLTPVRTGRMRGGYAVEFDGQSWSVVNHDAPYWIYVELGTRYMHARPHVRPAIEVVRGRHR